MALTLTKIFLHNWHRFRHQLIEVDGSFYLAGHNGSGKSSVLDAIQLVMVADFGRLRFNRLADEQSNRNLDSYVRGKLGENRWLRDFDTVGYVALEFATPDRKTVITAGVCIEASPKAQPDRMHFLISEPLDKSLFVPDGKNGLRRRDLKKVLKTHHKAAVFDPDVDSYQQDLLNRLGNLNLRSFYELFLRALHFRPEPNISRFVEQWVLDAKEVRTENLIAVRQRLHDLQQDVQQVEKRIQELSAIVDQQVEVKRLLNRRNEWIVVTTLLRLASAQRELDERTATQTRTKTEFNACQLELVETQAARTQTEDRYHDVQRQLFGNSTRQEADRLDKRIQELQQQIDGIQKRRHRLVAEFNRLTNALRPLWPTSVFVEVEHVHLENWAQVLTAFDPSRPPPVELIGALGDLIGTLETAQQRATERLTRLKDELKGLTGQIGKLQVEHEHLTAKGRRQPDHEAEHLRDRLEIAIGLRPLQLWETLEIRPEQDHWQEAVEVMLAARRFNFIVPPDKFVAAARELRRARFEQNIFNFGLIDLERAAREARPARPGSLATLVVSQTSQVQPYLDHVLGDIIACQHDGELRQHRRAITADLMLYSEWVQRPLRPPDLFIGQQAVQRRLRLIERELADLTGKRTSLEREQRELGAAVEFLKSRDLFIKSQFELESPLDESQFLQDLAVTRIQRDALDLSGLDELERQKAELELALKGLEERLGKLQKTIGGLETKLAQLASEISTAQQRLVEHQESANTVRADYPDALEQAEKLLASRVSEPDLSDEISNAERTRQGFEKQWNNAKSEYTRLASNYNSTENFTGNFDDPTEAAYAVERQRLEDTDLPSYRKRIDEAGQEADRELREHVLHSLRDSILVARQKLGALNEALRRLPPFRQEKYKFSSEIASDQREFYDLIMNSADLGDQPLQESLYYRQNEEVFEKFFNIVTHPPMSPADPNYSRYERILDYRRYLTYDIVITDEVTQREDRLSKIIHQRSGGETQAPFYLTIAASFVQLYRVQEHTQRPTLRMVIFDEAFSKMDQSYIGATLDMFHQFGLQIITATPLERCEYIAPKVRTSLVLTAVRDSVDLLKLDDYRNLHVAPPDARA